MNNKILFLSLSILFPVISACTPEQINSAIEACRGNPECYEIIDDAIEDELESRGITGGKMTNVELEEVYSILDDFSSPINPLLINMANSVVSETENSTINEQLSSYRENFQKILISNYLIIENKDYLSFREVNQDNKQLFIKNQIKYMIYKFSPSQFIYEVLADRLITIKIDTDLEAVFINNGRLFNNAFQYIKDFFTNPPFLGQRNVHTFDNIYKIINYQDDSTNEFEFQAIDLELNIFYYLYLRNNTGRQISIIQYGITYLDNENQSWGYGYEYVGYVLKQDLFIAMRNTSLILRIIGGSGNNFNQNFNFSESEEYFELINVFEALFSYFIE